MFRFGIAKREISPKMSMAIPGQFYKRYANEILDPLYAKAMFFEKDGLTVCTVVCDTLNLRRDDVLRIRRGISERCDIPEKNISVSATHTHTGGPTWDWYDVGEHNPIYLNMLVDGAVEAADEAYKKMQPAKIGFTKCEVPGYSFIRRYKLNSGKSRTGVGNRAHEITGPDGTPDFSLVIGKVCDESGKILAFISNYGVHLDMMGSLPNPGKISADYPGELARLISEKFGGDVESVFFTGPCGNTNHINGLQFPVKSRVEDEHPDYPPHKKTALALFYALCDAEGKIELSSDINLAISREFLSARLRVPTKEYVETATRILHGEDVIFKNYSIEEYSLQQQKHVAMATLDAFNNPIKMIDVEVMTFVLGDSAIVMWPAEVFVEYGKAVREKFSDKNIIIAELSNGSFGCYLPTEDAIEKGGYEVTITGPVTPEPQIGTDMVNATIELLENSGF